MAQNLKNKRKIGIILLVLSLICLVAAVVVTGIKIEDPDADLAPSIDNWESRYLDLSPDGWYVDEGIAAQKGISDQTDEDGRVEIIYGPFISLEKGRYVVRVNYECSDQQAIRVYCFENEDRIRTFNDTVLAPDVKEKDYEFELSEDLDGVEIRVSYNCKGSLLISDISICRDEWKYMVYVRNVLAVLALCFLSSGLVLFFIDRFALDGKRIISIDFARGIGILLVLLGHTEGNPYVWFIYGFHAPLFYIISGMLFRDHSMSEFIKKLLRKYMVPYYLNGFANSILRIPYMLVGNYTLSGIRNRLVSYWLGIIKGVWQEMPNCMPLWFLPALAAALLLFKLTLYIKNRYVRYVIYIICAVTGFYWNSICNAVGVNKEWPYGLHTFPTIIAIVAIGYEIAKRVIKIDNDKDRYLYVKIAAGFLAGTAAIVINYRYFSNVDIYFNLYGNIFLMYFGAISMSFALLALCFRIKGHIGRYNQIAIIGMNSVFFFGFDFWGRTVVSSFISELADIKWRWMFDFAAKLILISSMFVIWHLIKLAAGKARGGIFRKQEPGFATGKGEAGL